MTNEQILDHLEITLPLDLYKSRSNLLRLANLVHADIIQDGKLVTSTLSKTLSTSSNNIDLSSDNIVSVASVYALNSSGTTWLEMTKAEFPISTYPSDTLDQWYWELIGEALTFNKTATVDISIKVLVQLKATALLDDTNAPDIKIDNYLIQGVIKLLTNAEEYNRWLWNEAIPTIRETLFEYKSFSRKSSFF